MAGVKTYEDLMFLPFGYWGSLFVQVNMVCHDQVAITPMAEVCDPWFYLPAIILFVLLYFYVNSLFWPMVPWLLTF